MPSPIQARALLTARGAKGGFQALNVERVKNFFVDSAIDTDADTWNVVIGDPEAQLTEVMARDNEVNVSLKAIGLAQMDALSMGFADEIFLDTEGNLSISGRDISAVAADSQHPPERWRNARPDQIVAKEARGLGIGGRLNLSATNKFKLLVTDGSESYWEAWYRFYRKRQKWIWAEPDGTINAGFLNYGSAPRYKFGYPSGGLGEQGWIAIERAEWRKNTTSRIGEAFVFGHRGDIGFVGKQPDRSIGHWIKRPNRIIEDSSLYNQKQAEIEAREEIFESIVGAVEWRLVVADPGYVVKQNTMALVNIPEIGLGGIFFVVGAKTLLADDGLYQEVRLREKEYAISKRVPKDPPDGPAPGDGTSRGTGTKLNFRWGAFFAEGTLLHHGPWDYYLFLACMLGMCEVETGFTNVRSGQSGIEWYSPPSLVIDPKGAAKHAELFENETPTRAVGPMQLYSQGYKDWADIHYGLEDELVGGRWRPRSNIVTAARVFREKLRPWENSPTEANIWNGVRAYNGAGADAEAYMQEVKRLVGKVGDGGILDEVIGAAAEQEEEEDIQPTRDKLKRIPNEYTQGGSTRFVHESIWAAAVRVARKSGALISSAHRTEQQNEDANGAERSDHLCGYAVDYVPPSDAVRRAAEEENPYQILTHNAGSGLHVHVSFKKCPTESSGGTPSPGVSPKRVLVQAGHAPPREPGFEGGVGTPGEIAFTTSLRNSLLLLLDGDARFDGISAPGDIPNGINVDAAIFEHADGAGDLVGSDPTRGTSFGYQDNDGNRLASLIRAHYAQISGHPPAHADNYTDDLREYYGFSRVNSSGPEVVVESGFLTNYTERDWLNDHISEMARAQYRALLQYFGFGESGN